MIRRLRRLLRQMRAQANEPVAPFETWRQYLTY